MRRRSYFHRSLSRRTSRRVKPPAPDTARHCLAVLVIVLFGLVCMETDPRSFDKLLPMLMSPLTLVLSYYFRPPAR